MVSTAATASGVRSCVDKFGRPVMVRVNLARCHRQWQYLPALQRWELREVAAEAAAIAREGM
jgi:hypothetical protein